MVLEVERTLKERATLFVVTWLFCAFCVFYFVGHTFFAVHDAGFQEGITFASVVVGVIGAFATDAMVAKLIRAFRVARLGAARDRRMFLESRAASGESAGIALVAIEHEELIRAARIIATFPTAKNNETTTEELARLRYRLATESNETREKLVDAFLDWRPSTFGAHALELERYAAFVVASHVERDLSDRTQAIARRLLDHRDEQVRGYGSWLALEIEDLPKRASASADFGVGAALAKHHGHAELATLLDARASKLATGAAPSAYRD